MAVLIEGISVITRVDAIRTRFRGGEKAFKDAIPNRTSCVDTHLIRVGFMTPQDAKGFVDQLVAGGLRFFDGQRFEDMAIVDQNHGPTAPAPWLTIIHLQEERIKFAALAETDPGDFIVPSEWTLEQSLYRTGSFVPNDDLAIRMVPLGVDPSNESVERVFDRMLNKEMFVGRTNPTSTSHPGPVNSGAGRAALLEYLKTSQSTLENLRERLKRQEIAAQRLPWEVRWGLYYAGLTPKPE